MTLDVSSRLAATVTCDGDRTLVLANGFCTDSSSWDEVLRIVPDGWRIVRFEYVGNPGTPPEAWNATRYASLEGHAADVNELLGELDVRDALFVGHSMSGMVGALVRVQAPARIAEIAAIAPSPRYLDIPGEYTGGLSQAQLDEVLALADADLAAWMAGFAPAVLGEDASHAVVHAYVTHFRRLRPDIARVMMRSLFASDFRDILPQVDCPVTILQPKRDVVVPLAVGAYLAGHLPRASLRVLDVSGHLPHVTHAETVASVLGDILVRFEARRTGQVR